MSRTTLINVCLLISLCNASVKAQVNHYTDDNKKLQASSIPDIISLAGIWSFKLDRFNEGIKKNWFTENFNEQVTLPGTTDENHKGLRNANRDTGRLSRVYTYYGAAWYQKKFNIPSLWKGKHITLLLERTKTTTVWLDHHLIGSQNSLTTSHIFDLGSNLKGGEHTLTICVNNAAIPPVGNPHQISDDTQTNWNGILGRIELKANDPVWIGHVQLSPDVLHKKVGMHLAFVKNKNETIKGKLIVSAKSWNTNITHIVPPRTFSFKNLESEIDAELVLGKAAQLWDEFHPALYKLKIEFIGTSNGKVVRDVKEVDFGLRQFTKKGSQFSINGKTIFLRGTHDACVFPITGYAPMDVNAWVKMFRIARSYGLNHYRYHTWCPPAAAFKAADIVGIYMQPELPVWGAIGKAGQTDKNDVELRDNGLPGADRTQFLLDEGLRILKEFGNHASFTMLALGNELTGSTQVMAALVNRFRQQYPGILYAQGSNNFFWTPQLAEGDDYWTTNMTGGNYSTGVYHPNTKNKDVRGSYAVHTTGHINNSFPGTDYDYRKSISGIPVPVISHETGQYQVFPDFTEINKYKGVLKAYNFEIFRTRLKNAKMLHQANDFVKASGALAVICYREEIESALRTPGFGGFQLLDIKDFPGQGTALVGILNAFMDSKGLIKPSAWRQFCNTIVPLVRMKRYTWTTDQTFKAEVQVANYGPSALNKSTARWILYDAKGKKIREGKLKTQDIPQGSLTTLGDIAIDLFNIASPQKLMLSLQILNTGLINKYPIWVYPAHVDITPPSNVMISKKFDEQTIKILANGGKVFLLTDSSLPVKSVAGAFQSDFWSVMFKKYNPPGTLGILCNPHHPALKYFPTDFHSNWQWWPIVKHARPVILDETITAFNPIVQVIDNFGRNHKLGLVFEAMVGKGKLLVCSADLLKQLQHPEARQLFFSLLQYTGGLQFKPTQTLTIDYLKKILGEL